MYSGDICFDQTGARGNLLSLGNLDLILPGKKLGVDMDESSRIRFSSMSGHLFDRAVHERKHRLTTAQVNLLEKSFQEENKLEPERKSELARKLGLPPRQVAVWFQNRRARSKVKQIEHEYDLLKCLYDALRQKHELVLKENEKLKSKVLTLTEKLQSNGTNPEPATNDARSLADDAKPEDNRRSCAALSPVMEDEDRFSDMYMAAEQQPNDDEPFNRWVWQSISQPLW